MLSFFPNYFWAVFSAVVGFGISVGSLKRCDHGDCAWIDGDLRIYRCKIRKTSSNTEGESCIAGIGTDERLKEG